MSDLQEDYTDEEGLTLKDRAFLNILVDEAAGDVRRAMDLAGFPKDMPTSTITKRLKKQIQELSKGLLAINTIKAVTSVVSVLNDPTALGNKNIIAAAKEILDRGGVYKEEAIVLQDEKNMFILPEKVASKDEDD